MDIYKIKGDDLRVLLDRLNARSEPRPTCVRIAIDDGVKVKVDEECWTYPLGEREGEPEAKRYVIEYRDASGFDWERLTDETFDEPGDALSRRDRLIEREEKWLPRNRHRAIDRETGAILEWLVSGVMQ